MASRSLGTLTLDLVAKIGGFTAGMDKAERDAAKSAKNIEDSLKSISTASVAVGTALGGFLKDGIVALAGAFPALIEQAGQFQDIAEKTGGSAEGFAALAVSAKVGGLSMEELTAASIKLTKNLTGVDDESKAAGAALKAIGVSIEEFKKLSPDQQFVKLADALGQFQEGAGKTAVAVALLGKSGAGALPALKDLYEQGGAQKILTDEQIKQADDYADRQTRLRAQIGLYAAAIASDVLPAMTAFTGALKDVAKEMAGLDGTASKLGGNLSVQYFAENAGRFLAQMVDYVTQSIKELQALVDFVETAGKIIGKGLSFDFAGARQAGEEFRARNGLDENGFGKAGKASGRSFVQAFNDQLASQKRSDFAATDPRRVDLDSKGKPKDQRPTLKFEGPAKTGGGGPKDDPTKALLENQLKALTDNIEQEKDLFAQRNKFLDLYNSQGLISVRDYYAQRQNILDEATQAESKAYDAQAAALREFIANAPKETDRATATGKLNEVLAKQAKLHRDAGVAAIEASIKQVEAQKAVTAAFDEVNAKIFEFQGNLREAAAIRFDAANEKLLNTAIAEGNTEIVKRIGYLKEYTIAQASINKAQAGFAQAQSDLDIAETRIGIAQKRGTIGELEALSRSGEARRDAVGQLEKYLGELQSINKEARTPDQENQIKRLQIQLEQLQATADPLGDKINGIFGDAAGSAFGDFIKGTKSAKQALQDFASSVVSSFTDIIAKDLGRQLFSSLFGGSSSPTSAGGIGGWLSGLFGGGGSSDVLGSFITSRGFASGGFTGMGAANDTAGIVHRGEYVLDANTTRRLGVSYLDSIKQGGTPGGMQQTNNFAVVGKIDRRTETQIANKLRRETLTAGARF